MKALAIGYSRYLAQNRGRLPASDDDLKKFLGSRGGPILSERGITNVDELFVSSRDGKPLAITTGSQATDTSSPTLVVAQEKVGVAGKRLVALANGAVAETDAPIATELE